jgi:tetratricopeptide (TPR) repeat protein
VRARIAAEVVAHAERAGNRSMQFAYLAKRIEALAELGRFDAADHVIERYGRLAEELRSPVDVAIWCQFGAMRALMQGQWSAARPLIQRARDLARNCEPALFHDLGAVSAGLEIETAGFNARTLQLVDHGNASGWAVIRLYGYRELERPDLIEREIDATISDVVRVRSRVWLPVAMPLAQVISYIEDQKRAAMLLEWFHGFESLHAISNVYLGPVLLAAGTLCRTLGEWDRAIESLETALRMVLEVGSYPFECRVRLQLAASHAGRSRREDVVSARHHAAAALHLAEQLGMPSLDREARRRLESLGSS